MNRLIVLTAIACAFLETFELKTRCPRIIGGQDAQEGEFPYQLSLQLYSSYHICGASLLSATKALTAAHCTDGSVAEEFSVRAGSITLEAEGLVVNVTKLAQHQNFSYWTVDYDVSVLLLKSALSLGGNVNVVALPTANEEPPLCAVVTGWGLLSEGGNTSSTLQRLTVNRVSTANCSERYDGLTDRMICYTALKKDSCQFDNGGPLVDDGKQVGIVSWGYGCAQFEYPRVYTKVADPSILDYINENFE